MAGTGNVTLDAQLCCKLAFFFAEDVRYDSKDVMHGLNYVFVSGNERGWHRETIESLLSRSVVSLPPPSLSLSLFQFSLLSFSSRFLRMIRLTVGPAGVGSGAVEDSVPPSWLQQRLERIETRLDAVEAAHPRQISAKTPTKATPALPKVISCAALDML